MASNPSSVQSESGADCGVEKYLARQPIFDRKEAVIGYELLLRSGLDNFFPSQGVLHASEMALDNYFVFGLETLTGGRRAFVNFNRSALVGGYPGLLPKERIVVEILETVFPDPEVIIACRSLKEAGYCVALDDFVYSEQAAPLLDFADIVKIDFLATTLEEKRTVRDKTLSRGIQLLAEKVETHDDILAAVEMGCSYFQGHFYCRPQILKRRDVPGFRPNYLRLLRAVNRDAINLQEIEQIFKQEPSLLYKLLRYLNSAYFSFLSRINSIRHALSLLGEINLRRWTSVVALVEMAGNRPQELVVLSLSRARFCELLAMPLRLRGREIELFMLGLFSTLDVIVGRDMTSALREVPLSQDVKDALTFRENRFARVLDLLLAYEKADWSTVQDLAGELGLIEAVIPDCYLQSVEWTRQIFHH
ncbi:MAG: HDOD domain-containing protein [Acidobacteria bacterium]|nr:HDOD domain-containing protein [Acidobacteriota bacterium]